jgi:uncharacterized membrane protein
MKSNTLFLAAAAAVFMAGAAQAATLTLIPSDPAATSTAVLGINNAGVMTGAEVKAGAQIGFVRDTSGAYTGFSVNSANFVRSIDNAGNIIGYATDSSGSLTTDQVFRRASDGTITIVQDPSTHANLHGLGSADNASGQLVGDTPDRKFGFLLDGTAITDFQPPGATRTSARGIEDDGTIAGWATIGGVSEGYVLTGGPAGTYSFFTDPNETAGAATFFEDINNHGLVVGQWQDTSGNDHAFELNSATGVFTELTLAGASSVDAFGINDKGQVVLNAEVRGAEVNYLYTPGGVPEPATWAMMLTGFFGLGSRLRRRRAALAV